MTAMAVKTARGATCPTLPQPGQGGVRIHRGVESISDEAERIREDGTVERLGEVTRKGAEDVREAGSVRGSLRQQMDLVGAILTVVIAGAVAYAGLNVMGSIASTMSLSEGDKFYNASQSLESGIESFFTNMPTVFIVIALVLIIGYLTILRR